MKKRIKIIIKLVFLMPLLVYSNNNATKSNDKFIVVLDAGHGGKDPGAIGKHINEKDIALAITLKAGKYIEENLEDVKVIYTRTTDVFVPLQERADIANRNKAHLFLSIHVNANNSPGPYGTSSHILGLHRTEENFEVAKKENSVILLEDDYETKYKNFDPNSPESYIIFSVMQNIYQNQSIEMAALIQGQFRERANRKDRGVERQGLLVLAQCSMPGVLIETGFITNPKEEAFLKSGQGQEYMASAIYRAFKEYQNSIKSKSNFTAFTTGNEKEENNPKEEKKGKDRKEEGTYINIITNNEVEKIPVEEHGNSDPSHGQPDPNENSIKLGAANKVYDDTLVVFRIQVSSSYAKLDNGSGFFKGIDNIDYYETEGLYKYVTGADPSYDKMKTRLEIIRGDFPDAFIIAVKKGKIIPLQQAFQETSLKNDNIN